MKTLESLSVIEQEIHQKIKEGYSSTEIAGFRSCSPRTVEKHRSNIIKKLGIASSQFALIQYTLKNKINPLN